MTRGFRRQNVGFPSRFDKSAAGIGGRTVAVEYFQAGLNRVAVAGATIERPYRHQALRSLARIVDVPVAADAAQFQGDWLVERFLVHHGWQTPTTRLGCRRYAEATAPASYGGELCRTEFASSRW